MFVNYFPTVFWRVDVIILVYTRACIARSSLKSGFNKRDHRGTLRENLSEVSRERERERVVIRGIVTYREEGWGQAKSRGTFPEISIGSSRREYSFENRCHEIDEAEWARDKLRIIPSPVPLHLVATRFFARDRHLPPPVPPSTSAQPDYPASSRFSLDGIAWKIQRILSLSSATTFSFFSKRG